MVACRNTIPLVAATVEIHGVFSPRVCSYDHVKAGGHAFCSFICNLDFSVLAVWHHPAADSYPVVIGQPPAVNVRSAKACSEELGQNRVDALRAVKVRIYAQTFHRSAIIVISVSLDTDATNCIHALRKRQLKTFSRCKFLCCNDMATARILWMKQKFTDLVHLREQALSLGLSVSPNLCPRSICPPINVEVARAVRLRRFLLKGHAAFLRERNRKEESVSADSVT